MSKPGMTVRVQEPRPDQGQPTGRLYLGRGLYSAIGSPRRVSLLPHGARVLIQAGDEYAVVVPKAGQPRVSIGEYARELLALDAGTYAATVEERRIVVQRGEGPAVLPAAPQAKAPRGHGGKRPGSGRKTLGNEPMERHGVTLPVYLVQRLRDLGRGNLSAGIRAVVELLDGR